MLLREPNTKKVVLSNIYKLDSADSNMIKQRVSVMLKRAQSSSHMDFVKTGKVPDPRDGHSANVFDGNNMIVFGGDRNKFPFNDLYVFKF
jgi:hypothetical protein